jgi:hypothetical protein
MTDADKQKLRAISTHLADNVCQQINAEAILVDTPSMPYKTQWILEELIKLLQERV